MDNLIGEALVEISDNIVRNFYPNHKIEAIKTFRTATNYGLYESKTFIDAAWSRHSKALWLAKEAAENAKVPTVTIEVRGGVARVAQKDEGFRVLLFDYDNADDGESDVVQDDLGIEVVL